MKQNEKKYKIIYADPPWKYKVYSKKGEGRSVLEHWGFKYKTVAFVWIKKNKKNPSLFWGMGFWTRANAEICILATKGNPKRISARVHQVIISPIEEHSKKPNEARKRIEELIGDLPRIELFARQKADGWDVWGNEVESDIDLSKYGDEQYEKIE